MTDTSDKAVQEALAALRLPERTPFPNPHHGLDCDEAGYEFITGMGACYRAYDEDGNYDIEHVLMHPCKMNAACRAWDAMRKEHDAALATLRARIERDRAVVEAAQAVAMWDSSDVECCWSDDYYAQGDAAFAALRSALTAREAGEDGAR